MQVKKINPNDIDVYNFRKEIICVDEKSDIKYLENDIDRKHNDEIPEEVWKFSLRKWNSLNLDSLYGVYVGNDLVAISGAKLYGKQNNYLRAGMMYYILKRFRKTLRSPLWIKDGLLDAAVKDYASIDYTFISIYAHNSRLQAWATAFARHGRMSQLGPNSYQLENLRTFSKYKDLVMIKRVPQHVFYRKENNTSIDVENMIQEIQDK